MKKLLEPFKPEQKILYPKAIRKIDEISSVPVDERGPLDAWLAEAKAETKCETFQKNLLAKQLQH